MSETPITTPLGIQNIILENGGEIHVYREISQEDFQSLRQILLSITDTRLLTDLATFQKGFLDSEFTNRTAEARPPWSEAEVEFLLRLVKIPEFKKRPQYIGWLMGRQGGGITAKLQPLISTKTNVNTIKLNIKRRFQAALLSTGLSPGEQAQLERVFASLVLGDFDKTLPIEICQALENQKKHKLSFSEIGALTRLLQQAEFNKNHTALILDISPDQASDLIKFFKKKVDKSAVEIRRSMISAITTKPNNGEDEKS